MFILNFEGSTITVDRPSEVTIDGSKVSIVRLMDIKVPRMSMSEAPVSHRGVEDSHRMEERALSKEDEEIEEIGRVFTERAGIQTSIGRPFSNNTVRGRIRSSVYSAMKAGLSNRKDIIACVRKEHADISMKQILANVSNLEGIKREYRHWTFA